MGTPASSPDNVADATSRGGRSHAIPADDGRIAAALELVAPRLRSVRAQRGLTLTEAATLAGMSKSTLSRLETGQRRPSLELLLPLAQTYRVPPRAHDGFEWLYVLSGRMRLILGDQDLVLAVGEAAEFDTLVPHWFGSTGDGPAEVLSIFGRPGEFMRVRASGAQAKNTSLQDPHFP